MKSKQWMNKIHSTRIQLCTFYLKPCQSKPRATCFVYFWVWLQSNHQHRKLKIIRKKTSSPSSLSFAVRKLIALFAKVSFVVIIQPQYADNACPFEPTNRQNYNCRFGRLKSFLQSQWTPTSTRHTKTFVTCHHRCGLCLVIDSLPSAFMTVPHGRQLPSVSNHYRRRIYSPFNYKHANSSYES